MPHQRIFIGTYTNSGSRGIHAVELDPITGGLGEPRLAVATPNPTYLALSSDRKTLYAVHSSTALAAGFAVDARTGTLAPLPAPPSIPTKEPCYIAIDEFSRLLLVAHYRDAFIAALPLGADGAVGTPPQIVRHPGPGSGVVPDRQAGPCAHCSVLSPDGRFAFACDLGQDRIYRYRVDSAARALVPAAPPFIATAPGSGPRHLAFSRDGRHVLCIAELGNTIASYAYQAADGTLTPRDTRSTLPADFSGPSKTAAIRFHPNGRFVYGSNRGHDSIAVFAFDEISGPLSLIEIVPSGGSGPRDFALSPDGRWLVVAHQDSNSLAVFGVDPGTGRLARAAGSARISAPVCVLFA